MRGGWRLSDCAESMSLEKEARPLRRQQQQRQQLKMEL